MPLTKMINEKQLILAARFLSMMFKPFYLSIIGLIILFLFSYLSLLPLFYKVGVLAMVYFFTIFLPIVGIRAYRRYRGWKRHELGNKEKRVVPYIISILCYFMCCYTMAMLHMAHFMISILISALAIQIVCAVVNVWWKISTHMAAIGGVAGAMTAFAAIFMFNPLWWMCIVLLMAGLVGTSRMVLRQHTLTQVTAGFLIGWVVAELVVLTV